MGIPHTSLSPRMRETPTYIDLKTLVKEGLLTKKECKAYDFGDREDCIDYEKIYKSRFKVLKKAFERFQKNEEYEIFVNENAYWLEDYSLYMAIKDRNGGVSWKEWETPSAHKRRGGAGGGQRRTGRGNRIL